MRTSAAVLACWLLAMLAGCSQASGGAGLAAADAVADTPALSDVPDAVADATVPTDTPAADVAVDTAVSDVTAKDAPAVDVPVVPDAPAADVPTVVDGSVQDVATGCPAEPTYSGACSVPAGTSCNYGQECCCGKCYPSTVCSCNGGQWGCYATDACMLPPDFCSDAGSTDTASADGTSLPNGAHVVGAGWSFGECLGACKGDAAFAGASIDLTTSGWDKKEYFHAKGTLTTGAAAAMQGYEAALKGASLQAVYGCPDCADGGAAYITLEHDGVTTQHTYEFGKPPEVLKDIHGVVAAALDGLKACKGDATVVVSNPCPIPAP